MILESGDFRNNDILSDTFAFHGKNLSPHLKWSMFPEKTKSFALLCHDSDAPSGDFIHWIVYDIPKETTEIKQGAKAGKELNNDFGRKGYCGPSPPSGTHHYIFVIYALDTEHLDVNEENFSAEIKRHSIASAQIIGLYKAK